MRTASVHRRTLLLGTAVAALSVLIETACDAAPHAEAHPVHWSYDGSEGPAAWGDLSADYRLCANGTGQSPVDLAQLPVDSVALTPLRFGYHRAQAEETDNGHTIEDELSEGQTLLFDGRPYSLRQFHFHHPSEHTYAGRHAPMEMHLVHRDARGALLVVSVFVEEGAPNATLQLLFDSLPAPGASRDVQLDVRGLLPLRRDFVTYEGSLTTPPCSEGVRWVVLEQPLTMSAEQIETFAARYAHNNRPVAAPAGRHVQRPRTP